MAETVSPETTVTSPTTRPAADDEPEGDDGSRLASTSRFDGGSGDPPPGDALPWTLAVVVGLVVSAIVLRLDRRWSGAA